MEKTKEFGNRFLNDPNKVFEHNAWDDVAWDEEQEMEARKKVEKNSQQAVRPEMVENLESEADKYWDKFYDIHQNRFFKDRHWLFKEFPELLRDARATEPLADHKTKLYVKDCDITATCTIKNETSLSSTDSLNDGSCKGSHYHGTSTAASVTGFVKSRESVDFSKVPSEVAAVTCVQHENSAVHSDDVPIASTTNDTVGNCDATDCITNKFDSCTSNNTSEEQTIIVQNSNTCYQNDFPGCHAEYRIFEVGCGVGNTVFPVLQTNNDPSVFVYGCDLSSTAIQIVKGHDIYDVSRCHAFVCDVTNSEETLPFPDNSLDVVILIFVLSAVCPEKMQPTIDRLVRCLKPGGVLLFRDYGRYDLCQLRFKNGQCLSDNFYARQDGTRVYFFTQDELRDIFTKAGLTEEQNIVDRRLQVNRKKQLKMYRVWMQCKYRKLNKADPQLVQS